MLALLAWLLLTFHARVCVCMCTHVCSREKFYGAYVKPPALCLQGKILKLPHYDPRHVIIFINLLPLN